MKSLIIAIFILFSGCASNNAKDKPCPKGQNQCTDNERCTQVDEDSFCIPIPEKPWTISQFPFASGHPVSCIENKSQTSIYDQYAVKLASLPGTPAAKIYATESGVASIYDECEYRENSSDVSNMSTCGMGLGNHVRIFHGNGLMSVYAHLSEVYVSDGEEVEKGHEIGLEGASGKAYSRHLAYSIHRVLDPDYLKNQPAVTGYSQPFVTKIGTTENNAPQLKESVALNCKRGADKPLIYGIWE